MNTPQSGIIAPQEQAGAGTQTWALLLDAYRDLQSRKLFWLTLILSLLVAGVFGLVGINDQGITIAGRLIPSAFNTVLIPAKTYYKYLFTEFAIPFWLGFCAAILALVSVAGIFPDLISNGSIELYLSRPISRVRLFFTKYIFALSFTALQVLLFCAASFFIIGFRCGSWEWGIFLAVPLVTLFFSYLYCVCVLVGIVTRSTLAAILLTVLFWGLVFVIHSADIVTTALATAADQRVAQQQKLVDFNVDAIRRNDELPPERRGNMSAFEFQRDRQKETLAEYEQTADQTHWWRNLLLGLETPLPKTNETVDLMTRWLVDPDPIMAAQRKRQEEWEQRMAARGRPTTRENGPPMAGNADVRQEVAQDFNSRNLGWVIGTSLGFEIVVLSLAAWTFCRRDY